MKIVVIGYNHKPLDKRVFRSIIALLKHGDNEIYYIFNKMHLVEEELEVLPDIPALHWIPLGEKSKGFGRQLRIDRIQLDKSVIRTTLEIHPDVVYIHEPLYFLSTQLFEQLHKHSIPTVFDIHEIWGIMAFSESVPSHLYKIKNLFTNSKFKKELEYASKHIHISPGRKLFIEKFYRTSHKSSIIIPNVANEQITPLPHEKREPYIILPGKVPKNIEPLIPFSQYIKQRYGWNTVYIANTPPDNLPSYMEYHKPLPYHDMMDLISKAQFSVLIYRTYKDNNFNDRLGLPNKFFDSIGAGTPVVVDPFFIEMSAWINNKQIGQVVPPNSTSAIQQQIDYLLNNYDVTLNNIARFQKYATWGNQWEKKLVEFVTNVEK